MAWTQTDLDRLDTAIAAGVLRVKRPDGGEVVYASTAELIRARDLVAQSLAAVSVTPARDRRGYAVFGRT